MILLNQFKIIYWHTFRDTAMSGLSKRDKRVSRTPPDTKDSAMDSPHSSKAKVNLIPDLRCRIFHVGRQWANAT